MKTIPTLLMTAGLATIVALDALGQTPPAPALQPPAPPPGTNAVAPAPPAPPPLPAAAVAAAVAAAATNAEAAAVSGVDGTNGLRLNFHSAPLGLVLDFFADAAGFVINRQVSDLRGTVDVVSKEPVSKDEAVELLTSQLKKNGYAVTRKDRVLTIFSLEEAQKRNIPIVNAKAMDPDRMDDSDEVSQWIIPVRNANASQLMANLQPLLPLAASSSLSVNESANAILLVASQTEVKRVLKIINLLDSASAKVSMIKVFPLTYADSKDLATLVTQVFNPQGNTQFGGFTGGGRGAFLSMMAGGGGRGGFGGGGGPFGGFNPGGQTGGGGSTAANTRVVAVGDDRSNSLIVSAPDEMMEKIKDMVKEIDQPVTDVTEVRVFSLKNADPTELANQFVALFPNDTSSTGTQNPMGFFFGGRGGGFGRGNTSTTANNSDRARKLGTVTAVPDPRTSRIIVTASKTLMPQIADMVAELDSVPGKKEMVAVYDLQNTDPQDVQQTLQDLFNRSTVRMQNNNSTRSLLGTGNPLTQRATQTLPTINTGNNMGVGNTGRTGAGGLP